MPYILALDQGTTSSRAIVFDHESAIVATGQLEFEQIFPRPGWVEHDPGQIWATQLAVAIEALGRAHIRPQDIAAIGITNQRETTVVWDRETGVPVYNAIVWQDRRTAEFCDRLKRGGHEDLIRERTGLVVDAYFSGSKVAWILDNVAGARARADAGKLAFGTIDSWLVWKLTGGATHITDVSNASRTMLFNISTMQWDDDLLRLLGVPASMLPEVRSSSEVYGRVSTTLGVGEVPIAGIAGDQQAALFGQMCVSPGLAKNTYGTGCFLLQNTGERPVASRNRLLSTVAWQKGGKTEYALEGSVFVGGAVVQWLRDGLGIIKKSSDVEALAASVPDSGGVYLVPAFAGLGAPHWDQYARGTIVGITRGTTAGHIARAAVESIAFQVADLLEAVQNDAGIDLRELRVDGGAAANDALLQYQADLLGVPVVRPQVTETTALGAAYLAGLAVGFWDSTSALARHWRVDRRFEPSMPLSQTEARRAEWREALEPVEELDREGSVAVRRADMLARLDQRHDPWDIVVIGGGATGVGIAVDAASRGYDVLLLEQDDFGKGTSSRSTKLVHGGVRYLEQGNIALVMEALKERGLLRQNAPHLVSNLAFVVPNYDWWEAPFYGLGLKIYNVLAGKYGFGTSEILTREETLTRLPTIKTDGLRGGVVYYDGQFDDARLLINLVTTAAELGGTLLNHMGVVAITKGGDGFVDGVVAADRETGQQRTIAARVVVNATGPFSDSVRRLAEPDARTLMAPSQGIHLVFDHSFLPGETAIMVPHTSDGRVMFAIPWHGHTLVGTTDTAIPTPTLEPRPLEEEIEFVLETAGQYLRKAPTRNDVLSVFVGIRPLVKSGDGALTAALSRDHTIHIDASGLMTTTGGKWTTYRNMAEHTVDQAADFARLAERPCVTRTLNIHGFHPNADRFGALSMYGSDAPAIQDLMHATPSLAAPLHAQLPYTGAEVVWAVRHEMARTVEDVLARRTRALFLNARAAEAMAPEAARLMAAELGWDQSRQDAEIAAFSTLAKGYQIQTNIP